MDRTSGSLTIGQLKCEYSANPIGIGERWPRLSWKVFPAESNSGSRGLAQSAYAILVASDPTLLASGRTDLWNSGRVASNRTTFIEYAGKPLTSRQRAWWTVNIWDQSGKACAAPPAAFWEMGLLRRDDWSADWIGSSMVGGTHSEAPSPFFRKIITVPAAKTIACARLYATALGLYEFYLNGQRVGQDLFTPGYTDYRKRVQYQVYDVARLLCPGENVAGVILGDGWYCGYMGNLDSRQFYGDRPRCLAQLVIVYTDGSTQTIVTDGSWRTAAGPILSSDLMMGENYDARLEMPGWNRPGSFDDAQWNNVTVFVDPGIERSAVVGPPVRAIREIPPIEVKLLPGGNWLVDFGQNMVGTVRLTMQGRAGATVRMRFAEILDENGSPYTVNLRKARQADFYTLRGSAEGETWQPRFTFHGFRYVEIQDLPGTLAADDVVAILMHSDMPQIGSFECSDSLVNRLQQNIEWGQRGNFLEIPTDCPQRDERLGWTGDAQVFCRTAAFNFDVAGFFAKWTQDLRDGQGSHGSYPWIIPNTEIRRIANFEVDGDGGPAWADAGVICPWTMWLAYGDVRLIERHYESMVKFVEHLKNASEPFGLIRSHPNWKGWHGFGDWLSQDGKDGLFGNTPKDLIGTAFTAYDARLLSQIAMALGREQDALKYTQLSTDAAAAFRRRFVTPDGLILGNTQTAYVLALEFDLLPSAQRSVATDALVRNIRDNGDRLNTGFVGSPYLNHVLTSTDRLDVAYQLLMQKNWPGWLYAVTRGATTIWERWDGWTHDKGFQDAGMNSFNHYAYGAIGAWLYQVVAGIEIDPTRPGYDHVIFRPHPLAGGPLTHARASIDTLRGLVESEWRIDHDGRTLHYEVSVPPNVTATAHVPSADVDAVLESEGLAKYATGLRVQVPIDGRAVFDLAPGRYRFTSMLTQ